MSRIARATLPGIAAVLLSSLACSGDATGPFANLSAQNNPDDFLFIAQTYDKTVTTTYHYDWPHSGSVAQITTQAAVAGAVTIAPLTGSATISIKDAAGKQVYQHDLTQTVTDTTATGAPGTWGVDLIFSAVNGDIVWELKKATRDLVVQTTTTGNNIDPDGFIATLDAATQLQIAPTGTVTFSSVSGSSHSVALSGVAANCTVTDGNVRSGIMVPASVGTSVSFTVSCS